MSDTRDATRRQMRLAMALGSLMLAQDLLAVELIAHRGYACRAAQNSVAAVDDAWLAKADGVEIDLRVSKDGVVLAYHDEDIAGRAVAGMRYEEISRIAGHAAPTLRSILDIGTPPGYFVWDLKEKDAAKYAPLASLIAQTGIDPERVLVQGQSVYVLTAVRATLPDAKFYYLSDLKRSAPFFRAPGADTILARIGDAGLDGVSLKGRRFIDSAFVERLKAAGYRVNVWTINDPSRITHYRNIGVDAVITDELQGARAALGMTHDTAAPCFGDAAQLETDHGYRR